MSNNIKDVIEAENVYLHEATLTKVFPTSEIQTVFCNSTDNFHFYSLVLNGKKIRYKRIDPEATFLEFGDRLFEEEKLYSKSKIVDNRLLFKNPYETENVYNLTEDQLMENFAFTIAERHLGVYISSSNDADLMFNTTFRKYKYRPDQDVTGKDIFIKKYLETKRSWLQKLFNPVL